MSDLKPGFYAVRQFPKSRLEPAELCSDGFWYTIGDSRVLRPEQLHEIRPAPIVLD